jgi:hypothetical protein
MYYLPAIGRMFAAAVLVAWLVSDAAASHPDILRDYRFIPSHSILEVTGGFAGIEQTFHARGTFGLVTGYEEGYSCMAIGCPPPSHIPFAQFVDVRAWLVPDSPLAYVWDLDQMLNLSGLDGTFQIGAPDRLYFRGVDGQGQPFQLTAVLRDRLLHMFGENDPGCCDFFHYKFKALAYLRPHADFNLDSVVDAGDYITWRRSVGQTGAPLDADGNGDGVVDAGDYELWRAQFGETVNFSEFADGGINPGAVPEPATAALLLAGIVYFLLRRRV